MRVLVCGGRDYNDREFFCRRMAQADSVLQIAAIIEGFARGADTLARLWAIENGRELCTYPADWATYGKSAGMIRNKLMLTHGKPDLVIAFPGGRGTANMIAQAHKHHVTVWKA